MQHLYDKIRFRFGLTWGVRTRRSVSTSVYITKRICLILLTVGFAAALSSIAKYAGASDEALLSTREARQSLQPALDIIKVCLAPGDNPLYIGDELWFVGAAKAGIKKAK